MSQPFSTLQTALTENNIIVSPSTREQFTLFLTLLHTWNRAFNLTAITDPEQMVQLHLIDSLLIQPYLTGNNLLDVGSGGGLPGIPLAIMNPHQQWTLLDKNSKKTRFLTQVVAELGLKNVKVAHSRVEHFQTSIPFTSITSRAFSTLATFVESTEHLLAPNGVWIAMKGKYPTDEMNELPSRFHIKNVTRLELQGVTAERHVLIVARV